MDPRLKQFYDQYFACLQDAELGLPAELFDEPFVHIGPYGARRFTDVAPFLAQSRRTTAGYIQAGMCGIRNTFRSIVDCGPWLREVEIDWRILDRRGHTMAEGGTVHVVRVVGDSVKLSLHISMDEPFQRPSMVEPGAAAVAA